MYWCLITNKWRNWKQFENKPKYETRLKSFTWLLQHGGHRWNFPRKNLLDCQKVYLFNSFKRKWKKICKDTLSISWFNSIMNFRKITSVLNFKICYSNVLRGFASDACCAFKPRTAAVLTKMTRYEFEKKRRKHLSEDELRNYVRLLSNLQ